MEPCRYCQQLIVFVDTAKGRRMPCEPQLQAATAEAPVIDATGELVKSGVGHLPHWKQCKKPSRKKR